MRTRLSAIIAVVGVVVGLAGCAATKPVATPAPGTEGTISVRVEAEPGVAAVTFKGRSVGNTPASFRLASLEDVLAVAAEQPPETWVEQRVRVLSPTEINVLFRFGKDAGPLARRLGLGRVLVFDYSSTATFDVDSFELKPGVLSTLTDQARLLGTAFAGVDVHVCGHTDSSGSESHNLELSLQRAQAVASFLGQGGVPAERLKVLGLASEFPVADNATPEGKALNRRTELVLPK